MLRQVETIGGHLLVREFDGTFGASSFSGSVCPRCDDNGEGNCATRRIAEWVPTIESPPFRTTVERADQPEGMCSAKMAGERHEILRLGHRAAAIVENPHGTDDSLAHQMRVPGSCRRRAPVDLRPILPAQTTIGESGNGLNQELPLSDKKNRIRYRRGWFPRHVTHGVSHERLVRG